MIHRDQDKKSGDSFLRIFNILLGGAVLYGAVAALVWLTGASLVLYILYRIVTHPW